MASEELEAFCVQHKDPKWKKKEKFLVENNTSYHVHSKVENVDQRSDCRFCAV